MATRVIEAFVATSRPLTAYGGVQLAPAVLDRMAESLRSGQIPMQADHDMRRPLFATVLQAEVRDTPDGYAGVWVELEVDSDEWAELEREHLARGHPGGFSFSGAVPVATVEPLASAPAVVIRLAADAAFWDDDDLLAAGRALNAAGRIDLSRRYAFAFDPTPIVVVMLAMDVGVGVIANALYDGLRRFILPDRRTTFEFQVKRKDERIKARLETNDPEAMRKALDTFDAYVNPDQLNVWDDEHGQWGTH